MKPIKNNYWNGKDANFLRCINSETGEYHDLMISWGQNVDSFSKICEMSYLLNSDFGIITGKFFSTDVYIAFHTNSGNIMGWKENETYGNVVGCGYKGFWMDIDTFKINSVCNVAYSSGVGCGKGYEYEDGIEQYIIDYNNKILNIVL